MTLLHWEAEDWTQQSRWVSPVLSRGDHLSWPASNVLPNAAQEGAGLLGVKDTLLVFVLLYDYQDSQVLFPIDTFHPVVPQNIHTVIHRVIPPQMQGFAFLFHWTLWDYSLLSSPIHPLAAQPSDEVGNWKLIRFCYSFSLILLYNFTSMLK